VDRDEPVYPTIWVFGSIAMKIWMIWMCDRLIFSKEIVIGGFGHIGESAQIGIGVRLDSQLDLAHARKLTYPR
jgi:hypothetical protein